MSVLLETYHKLKDKHPDAILLLRIEEYYVCVSPDAATVADILKIEKWDDFEGYAAIKFPAYQLEEYVPKLVKAGQKVAITDEIKTK